MDPRVQKGGGEPAGVDVMKREMRFFPPTCVPPVDFFFPHTLLYGDAFSTLQRIDSLYIPSTAYSTP